MIFPITVGLVCVYISYNTMNELLSSTCHRGVFGCKVLRERLLQLLMLHHDGLLQTEALLCDSRVLEGKIDTLLMLLLLLHHGGPLVEKRKDKSSTTRL